MVKVLGKTFSIRDKNSGTQTLTFHKLKYKLKELKYIFGLLAIRWSAKRNCTPKNIFKSL
jgi:hypothetical protein